MAAHWMDGEPISDGVAVMAAIEDRYRSYVVDGDPVVTGVVAVGDAWSCTNPSLGRGTSIGILHAKGLRDVLREVDTAEHELLVRRFDELTRNEVEPWYRRTLAFDRHRLAEIEADIAGHRYATDDPGWQITKAWTQASTVDSDVYRTYAPLLALQSTPEDLELLPPSTLAAVRAAEAATQNYRGMYLRIAAAYGGREEIVDAVKRLLQEQLAHNKSLAEVIELVTPEAIGRSLYAPDLPDPDLIIRTSGEIRLSGFLLWQSAFSEFYFTDVYWPAFRRIDFLRAVRAFQQRQRRFGK